MRPLFFKCCAVENVSDTDIRKMFEEQSDKGFGDILDMCRELSFSMDNELTEVQEKKVKSELRKLRNSSTKSAVCELQEK